MVGDAALRVLDDLETVRSRSLPAQCVYLDVMSAGVTSRCDAQEVALQATKGKVAQQDEGKAQ
jgi:hypothetical protein